MSTPNLESAGLANKSSTIVPKTPESFIMKWDKVFSLEECNKFIELYNFLDQSGYSTPGEFNGTFIPNWRSKNEYIFLSGYELTQISDTSQQVKKFWDKLGPCIDVYIAKFGEAWPCKKYDSHDLKAQKIQPGGGYHVWHSEWTTGNTSRVLAWMVYLNDMPQGEGETEFLYQGLRVQPKAGRILMWPAGFTHTHRGNPVYSHDKYQITGWLTASDEM